MEKSDFIKLIQNKLPKFLYPAIKDWAKILFDLAKEDLQIVSNIQFLNQTKLSDIEFLDIDNPNFFIMRNMQNGNSIQFSNRPATCNELRAELLRRELLTRSEVLEQNSGKIRAIPSLLI